MSDTISTINVNDLIAERDTLREEVERLTMERDIAVGERVSRAKAMLHVRDQLSIIDTNIEDETDRVYFRSTNDADAFKDVVQELEDWAWHDILRDTQKVDPFETSRLAIKRAEAAEAALAKLHGALKYWNAAFETGHSEPLVIARDHANRVIASLTEGE